MRPVFLIAVAALASPFTPAALGWGCDGHRIIAFLARAHLTPEVSAAVDRILNASPIAAPLSGYCKERLADPMADSAGWADGVRGSQKNGAWHYIDIPRGVTVRGPIARWCPPLRPARGGKDATGCVVNALDRFVAILRDRSRPADERATALRYVIHLVGDIHQPLHAIDNFDEGGNCTSVRFGSELDSLHSIWDSSLLRKEMQSGAKTDRAFAASLDARFGALDAALASAPVDNPESWAWAANELARNVAYADLNPAIPVVAADTGATCAAQRKNVQALHIVIGSGYLARASLVVDEQLAKAGFRLARLLNSVLGP